MAWGTSHQLECRGTMKVIVADGEHITCLGVFCGTPFSITSEAFKVDLLALPLASYNVVLDTH